MVPIARDRGRNGAAGRGAAQCEGAESARIDDGVIRSKPETLSEVRGSQHPRRAPKHPQNRQAQRAQNARHGPTRSRRPKPPPHLPLPPRVLRRPTPTHRHRPRPSPRTRTHSLRRTRLRTAKATPTPSNATRACSTRATPKATSKPNAPRPASCAPTC
jgi:hypothetical protein